MEDAKTCMFVHCSLHVGDPTGPVRCNRNAVKPAKHDTYSVCECHYILHVRGVIMQYIKSDYSQVTQK